MTQIQQQPGTVGQRFAELVDRFREAANAIPHVPERLADGQQFNVYESAWTAEDEECDDDDREYTACIGPITDAWWLFDIDRKRPAELIEAALKLAQHIAFATQANAYPKLLAQRDELVAALEKIAADGPTSDPGPAFDDGWIAYDAKQEVRWQHAQIARAALANARQGEEG